MTIHKEDHWTAYLKLMKSRPELFCQDRKLEIVTDKETVKAYEKHNDCTIGVVYQSRFNILVVDLVRNSSGIYFTYERVIPTEKGGIVSVPLYEGRFVLLRQFRHAIRQEQYAFPRGFGEPGLSAEENLTKELQEEIGASELKNVQHLGQITPDSGLSAGIIDVFSCEVNRIVEKKDYEGISRLVLLSEEELRQWIRGGRINDGFTLGACEMYRQRRTLTGRNLV